MIETILPLPAEPWATLPAPDQPPLIEQVATLRLENAALGAQNSVLQQRLVPEFTVPAGGVIEPRLFEAQPAGAY
jgi:hypothetical protein